MRSLMFGIDRWLRRRMGVFEYWDHPDCIFRLRVGPAERTLSLDAGEVLPGEVVLELHLWNEHVLRVSEEYRDLALGIKGARRVMMSLERLAGYIADRPDLARSRAIGGVTTWFSPGERNGAERIFQRLGFQITPHVNHSGRVSEFWERVYAWLLLWAFRAGSRQRISPIHVPRTDFWMRTGEFLRRFSPPPRESGPDR